MTGTRIRWEDAHDGEATGRVGSLDWPVFRIWPPDEKGDCMLFVYLAGHQGDLYHGTDIEEQKAKAESLLSEFVSSLGAVFPEDEISDDEEPDWRFEWELIGRDGSGNAVLKHKSTGGRYRIIPEEDL